MPEGRAIRQFDVWASFPIMMSFGCAWRVDIQTGDYRETGLEFLFSFILVSDAVLGIIEM
jgi:hypothetical protein